MNSEKRKKNKVLVFFQDANHYHTIDYLCNNLYENGVEVASFNIATWRYRGEIKIPFWVRIAVLFATLPKMRGLLSGLLRNRVMLKIAERFDIVDIHFFSPLYDKIIEELYSRRKKIKITIWGSDFYRVDNPRIEQQRALYQKVDIVQIETQQIANDILEVFPELIDKIRFAHFGIIQFDIIDNLLLRGNSGFYRKMMKLPSDKIIIACGTNGSTGHQHDIILDALSELPARHRERLFLILPMTYGGAKGYIAEIRRKMDALGMPGLVLTSFLSLDELCKYRIVSDMLITIQKTDALASAIQEHLYAGGIMIAGEWLPYGTLSEMGVFYLTASLESLTDTISHSIDNHIALKETNTGNKEILKGFSSWDSVIGDWLIIYNELSNA